MNNQLRSFPNLDKFIHLQKLYCENNFIKVSTITSIFRFDNRKQYYVNYLASRIQRLWKRYHYGKIIGNSYNDNIKDTIFYFI